MKKNIYLLIFCLIFLIFKSHAQDKLVNQNDLDRIILTTFISDQIENVPSGALNNLHNKLDQIVSANGFASTGVSPNGRFIITPNVTVTSKNILPSAPPQVAITLDLNLYVGDGYTGTKFSSIFVTLKGVGRNENKAYANAFNQLRSQNIAVQELLKKSKIKILEFYNTECEFILSDATMAANQNNPNKALNILNSIPRVSENCYNKAMEMIVPIYKKKIDYDCTNLLQSARNIWNTGQNYDNAIKAVKLLGYIEPNSNCYKEAVSFSNTIGSKIKQLDDREWNFVMKVYDDNISLKESAIKASRDVGVAYGNNQPETITSYNIRGWW